MLGLSAELRKFHSNELFSLEDRIKQEIDGDSHIALDNRNITAFITTKNHNINPIKPISN